MPRLRERLSTLLAIPRERDARIFAVAAVVDSLGNGLFVPISALFFVKVVGIPTTRVGFGLSVAGLVALLGPLLAGPPVDRFGARRTVLVLNVLRAVAYGCYPLVGGFWPFLALVAFTGVLDTMARPALQALVATLSDDRDRVTMQAFVRSVRNLGWGAGGVLVTVALAIGTRSAYVAVVLTDAATFVVAALLLARVRDVRVPLPAGPRTGYGTVLRDRRFVALTLLHGVMSLHLSILLIGFPLWIDQRTSAPTAVAGAIATINSFLVVFLQVPFSRRAGTVRDGGRALRLSGYALLATCVLLALTPGLPAWPAALVLLGIGVVECAGEMWHSAGGWGVSFGLAPAHARGRYLGVFALGHSVHDIAGPLLMALIVSTLGWAGWLALGVVLAACGVLASRLTDAEEPLPQRLDPVDGGVDDGRPG
jgi:MFS family permease